MKFFSRLEINQWQQFRSVAIDFHDRLTVLTGANASGKTTLLNLLGRHVNWDVPSLAVPQYSRVEKLVRFLVRFFSGDLPTGDQIGTLTYSTGQQALLRVPQTGAANYQVSIEGQQEVPCFFVPSHRSVYRYQQVTQIPTVTQGKEQAFNRVLSSTRSRYFGGGDAPSSFHMKELLISWSIFGRRNVDMIASPELLELYEGFQEILRKVLPATLGFRRFSLRNMEVVLECDSGDWMIDGASGGLSTIIDLAWQIFMFPARGDTGFTVIVDEVENHLHPTMQRRVLPDFLEAFQKVRFVVSTHSPLIVNSVRESSVYVLRYDDKRTVVSEQLDLVDQARTATQILDEVLGVTSTMPIWAEEEIAAIVRRFSSGRLDESAFQMLRTEMSRIGLADYVPQALGRLLDTRQG